MLTQSKNMTNLEELITNIELCSKADGYSTVTFPTLKKLSVNGKVFGSSLTSITADKMNGMNSCEKWGFVPAEKAPGDTLSPTVWCMQHPPLAMLAVP